MDKNSSPIDTNSVSNTCSQDWLVHELTPDKCLLKIVCTDKPDVSETTDDTFCIYKLYDPTAVDPDVNYYVDLRDFAILASAWLME